MFGPSGVASGHDGTVRRALVLTGAWLLAAVVAVAVAWQGVGIVTRNVTDDRPASLAASEVRELAAEPDATTTTTSVASPSSVPPAATSTSAPVPAVTPAARPTATTSSPPTTAAPPVTSAPPTTATATTATTAAPAETRTYNVVGGSVALRFSPEGVTVVWATPNDGFEVEVEPENVNGVQVEFESESHRSRVDGWWDGGPQDRVREEPG